MRKAAIILVAVLLVMTAGCGSKSQVSAVSVSGNEYALSAQAQIKPQLRSELAAELERVLRLYPPRQVSAPPSSSASATVLSWDEEAGSFQWRYYSAGDYDQNGEVGVSDLTPLGVHFGKQSAGGPFDQATVESVVDGDQNGQIGISDITPIGQNFGLVCEGYRLYYSNAESDVPGEAAEPNGPGAELVAEVIFSDATGAASERKQFSHTPAETPFEGYYWVRPHDDEQLGTPSNAWLLGAANQPPIAVLRGEPSEGLFPLTVDFQAFSSIDIDGTIVNYEWDFDGPIGGEQWLDSGAQGFVEHTYEDAGDYLPTVRVTDDDGATDVDILPVKVRAPLPPTAMVEVDPASGAVPLEVVYDASGSFDTDGPVARYEWDFDGDGEFEHDSGLEPTAPFIYWAPGSYDTAVQVTDIDGLTDVASVSIAAEAGAQWYISTVLESTHNELENTGGSLGGGQLAEVDGRPAMTMSIGLPDDSDFPEDIGGDAKLVFILAVFWHGKDWYAPVVIDPGGIPGVDYSPGTSRLALIDHRPAVLYGWRLHIPGDPAELDEGVKFVRAADYAGSAWYEPLAVQEDDNSIISQLMFIDGCPAFFSRRTLYPAADAAGASWPYAYELPDYGNSWPGAFELVQGNPAFAQRYPVGESLFYTRALNAEGSAWPEIPTVVLEKDVDDPELVIAAGHPAIAFYDSLLRRIMYTRALDSAGAEWESPRTVAAWTAGQQSMTLVDGRPASLYVDEFTDETLFIAANDAEGTSWGLPMVIDVVDTDGPVSNPSTGSRLVTIGGHPAFTYTYATYPEPQVNDYHTRYVVYY